VDDNEICARYPNPSCENAGCGTKHRINTGCCDHSDCTTDFCFNNTCKVRNGDICFRTEDCISPQVCTEIVPGERRCTVQ
jgi:hypothetical protein